MKKIIVNLSILTFLSLCSCASFMEYNATESEVQLTQAILKNDVATVKTLLAQGASPDSRMPSSGAYVLSIALDRNDIAMAKILLDAGASANSKDRYDQPLLHFAKKAPMIRLLLEHGADMYAEYQNKTAYEYISSRLITTNAEKQTMIANLSATVPPNMLQNTIQYYERTAWVSKQDLVDTVKVYNDFKYDVNQQRGSDKRNVLFYAADFGNFELLTAIVTLTNANVNLRNHRNHTLLGQVTANCAIKNNAAEYDALVAAMVQKNVRLDDLTPYEETSENATPLMIAAQKNEYGRCLSLLRFKANPKIVNENSKAAINFSRNFAVIKLLVDNGADPLNKDKWQQTTLYYQKDVATMQYLLALGVPINSQDTDGETVLFSVRDAQVVAFLASRGLDINHVNNNQQSTLEVDVRTIIKCMAGGDDVQDQFTPKFATLVRLGMSRPLVNKARDVAASDSQDLTKVLSVLQ